MKNEWISIIIPVYNRAKLVPKAIQSVLNQTRDNWELIIVDDGSTDDTAESIKRYLKDNRIKYIKKENTGAAHSRNVGVDNAKGEWIAFLDSDDTWESNKLEKNSEYIKKYGESYCFYSGFRSIDANTDKILEEIIPQEEANMTEALKNDNPIHALPTVVVSKKLFLAVGGFDNLFKARQDVDLYYRLSKNSIFMLIPEILVNIYRNSNDRISANYNNRISGFKRFYQKYSSEMNFNQKSYLAKRIVYYALKEKVYLEALKWLPLSLKSIFANRTKI